MTNIDPPSKAASGASMEKKDRSHAVVKRSVRIAGHPTSVSLEDAFWDALRAIATERRVSLNALIAEIDNARDSAAAGNLSSAIRVHILQWYRARTPATSGPTAVGSKPVSSSPTSSPSASSSFGPSRDFSQHTNPPQHTKPQSANPQNTGSQPPGSQSTDPHRPGTSPFSRDRS